LSAVEYDSRGQVVVREVNHWDVFGNLLGQEVYSGATGQTSVTRYARQVAGLSETALSQARVGDRLRESGEPGGGAARIQEMSVSHDPWQVYRRRRWIARVCLLLLIIPGTCLHNILLEHEKMNPVAAFCLSWGILLVIFLFFHLSWFLWPCPRCGKPFHKRGLHSSLFNRHCLNCGLPKWAKDGVVNSTAAGQDQRREDRSGPNHKEAG
jgi:hypothetical protein